MKKTRKPSTVMWRVSDELAAVVGSNEATVDTIRTGVYGYIKEHNLQVWLWSLAWRFVCCWSFKLVYSRGVCCWLLRLFRLSRLCTCRSVYLLSFCVFRGASFCRCSLLDARMERGDHAYIPCSAYKTDKTK